MMIRYSFLWLCVFIGQISNGQSKKQIVRFANFSLTINNFYSECYHFSRFSDENTLPLKAVDTIFICETPCDSVGWYINGQTINIITKSLSDSFVLFYANEYDINQGYDSRIVNIPNEGWDEWYRKCQNWKYISNYKRAKAISTNCFKLPFRENFTSKVDISSIKQKFGLRDTMIEIPHEAGLEYMVFTKNSKLFSMEFSYLRMRINRFSNGKLMETKYVLVGISEGCD